MTTPESQSTPPMPLIPITLKDLYEREAACRTAPDYTTGYEDNKRAAMSVQIQMAAYRVMPLISWPGGPYFGNPIGTADRRYALFNLAGALQIALRIRQDQFDRAEKGGYPIGELPMKLDSAPLTEMAMLGDLKGILAGDKALNYRLANSLRLLDRLCQTAAPWALPWTFVINAAPVLHFLNLTVNDLAGAYLEATNGLVPPAELRDAPGGITYPAFELPEVLDPNGEDWVTVRNPDGKYRAQCAACGQALITATPVHPDPCPRCAASAVIPATPEGFPDAD